MGNFINKTITNRELWEAASGIQSLAVRKDLKGKTLYWLGKTTKKLSRQLEELQNLRTDLAKKHIKKDPITKEPLKGEAGGEVIDAVALRKEFEEILKAELEINIWSVSFDDVDKKQDTTVTCPKCDKEFETPTTEVSLTSYEMFSLIELGVLTFEDHEKETRDEEKQGKTEVQLPTMTKAE